MDIDLMEKRIQALEARIYNQRHKDITYCWELGNLLLQRRLQFKLEFSIWTKAHMKSCYSLCCKYMRLATYYKTLEELLEHFDRFAPVDKCLHAVGYMPPIKSSQQASIQASIQAPIQVPQPQTCEIDMLKAEIVRLNTIIDKLIGR